MKKSFNFIFYSLLFFSSSSFLNAKTTITQTPTDNDSQKLALHTTIAPGTIIYKEYISLSVNHPDIELSEWYSDKEPISRYDATFKETKKIFDSDVTLYCTITKKRDANPDDVHLRLSYYAGPQKKFVEELFPITFATKSTNNPETANTTQNNIAKNNISSEKKNELSWSAYISNVLEKTESPTIRILLALLLGLLLSLTPCIYPMIPITVGILHAHGSKSIFRNFCIALSYTIGIATTFALLGLLAAFAGQLFGSFLQNPFVIIVLIALLIYVALSLLGLYELYIPRFLQQSKLPIKGGSFIAAFIFGIISGSIASPCLSPGLLLLLTIVTTLGSKLTGFILLFFFGIGLSLPLLLVGTFSSSLSVLPQAGLWMIEIKYIFGFMLLGMCFYFLNSIIPWYLLLWLFSFFVISTGIFCLNSARKMSAGRLKTIKNAIGMLLIACSVLLFAQSYKATYIKQAREHETRWHATDYTTACEQARQQQKKLFIAFSTQSCSLCKLIDKTVFSDSKVRSILHNVITAKIDLSDTSDSQTKKIQQQFSILGVPTYMLIDPATEQCIKRWGSELYDKPKEQFIAELQEYIS